MTLSLELEIKTLLEEFRDPEVVAEKLIQFFEDHPEDWSANSLRDLARFLRSCGLHQPLIAFCLRHLKTPQFVMPWSYFIESLVEGLPDLPEDLVQLVTLGIEEDNAAEQVCLARGAERFLSNAAELKSEIRRRRLGELSELKYRHLDELRTLHTQQLYEQEKILTDKLQRMFPGDADILKEIRKNRERNALDILTRHSPLGRARTVTEPPLSEEMLALTAGFNDGLLKMAELVPEITFDFAVAAYMLDEATSSLALLEKLKETSDLTTPQRWFYLEVKLKCRHFLEVLDALNTLELQLASEPETFFATAYLRAQAYWGLDQPHVAIEILESLLSARPNYRSASVLLDMWRAK